MKKSIQAISSLLLASIAGANDFETAYKNEALWPSKVTPNETVYDADGKKLIEENIPVAFIRAYPDGHIAIVDRIGSVIVDHSKTDFIDLMGESELTPKRSGNMILLNQIGRRCFDLSHDKKKAVSESVLMEYRSFLFVRTSCQQRALSSTLDRLEKAADSMKSSKVRPILIFDELIPNEEFYAKVLEAEIPYPVVVPIFQKGLVQALYTERENGFQILLISINGKLEATYRSLEDYIESL